jgi:hypothetical protein
MTRWKIILYKISSRQGIELEDFFGVFFSILLEGMKE